MKFYLGTFSSLYGSSVMSRPRLVFFPSVLPSMIAFYPLTRYPMAPMWLPHTPSSPRDEEKRKAATSKCTLRISFFYQEAKILSEASLADFPLYLIGRDCHRASPSGKGGWKLRHLGRRVG